MQFKSPQAQAKSVNDYAVKCGHFQKELAKLTKGISVDLQAVDRERPLVPAELDACGIFIPGAADVQGDEYGEGGEDGEDGEDGWGDDSYTPQPLVEKELAFEEQSGND
ncbi:uncharacterized protein PAC_19295 [Phialocephala subalpina]|uniref:Uncharacterized protein n=1 Tax=Phialocephala subalpina TaxID=576137 RepID=A0A1L7XWP6_9HELO|nr:uncharacterized protein PAC_19295 [Phialocephala subalpina]